MANKLGLSDAAKLPNETLEEEEEADKKLSEVAEGLYEEVETGEEAAEGDEEEMAAVSRPARAVATKRR
jgi:hypothetical protein